MILEQERKKERALRRRKRVQGKVAGTALRPRLSVYRSLKHVYAQIVDDVNRQTITAAASTGKKVRALLAKGAKKTEVAKLLGQELARLAKEKGITQVVFDRNRYRYHGRVKAVADGLREGGVKL